MDKFIQLPFTIPPSDRNALKSYVGWLSDDDGSPVVIANGGEELMAGRKNEGGEVNIIQRSGANAGGEEKALDLEAEPDLISSRDPNSKSIREFKESSDVGFIIREATNDTSGNPREIKRIANLARLYLGLRNTRRDREPAWRSPNLSQYTRWIVVALRWPDMMRWLQWGADEATWSSHELSLSLSARRLHKLEELARSSTKAEEWKGTLVSALNVPGDKESDWAADPKLFEYFKSESELPLHQRLSDAAQFGFW